MYVRNTNTGTVALGSAWIREQNDGDPVEFGEVREGDEGEPDEYRTARVTAELGEQLAGAYETVEIHERESGATDDTENDNEET